MPAFGFRRGRLTTLRLFGATVYFNEGVDKAAVGTSLRGLAVRMQDMQRPLSRFGRYLVEQHIPAQFAQQGFPRRWAPLSPAYAARRGAGPLLIVTGEMAAGFSYTVRAASLVVSNDVRHGGTTPIWRYHQLGTSKMPARPMLQLQAADRQQFVEYVHEWLAFETGSGVL